ncbi:MAG: CoA-binding protein, partial [bacterium]
MRKLFYPDSVAVVGLSANALNLAGLIAYNLKEWEYGGKVYGVNPRSGGEVHGAKIFPSLADVPGPVDLVAVLAPARTIPELLDQCVGKGVEYMVIETAGFSEFSEEGRALGDEIRRKAGEYGIRFVGPNCVGIINAENGLSLPFTHIEPWEAGRVSVLSQSGGVGLNTLMWLGEHNLASNKFVSMGNKYDLDEVDYLEYLIGDDGTDVILLFLESLVRGREFAEAAARSEKPIIVYKAGTTEAGLRRARSHTAALANDDDVLDAALRQAGVIRVDEIQKLAAYARMFSQPRMRGKRVAVISQAGGYTVITADHAERAGFTFPALSKQTRKELEKRLRAGVIRLSNPLDLGDAFDSDTMLLATEKSLQDGRIDGVVVIQPRRPKKLYRGAFEVMMRNIVPETEALVAKYGKPVVIGILGTPEVTTQCRGDSS